MKDQKMFSNILFATDLSEGSAHAINWLRWLCRLYGSSVYVVYVLNLFPFGLSADEIVQERSAAAKRFDRFIRKHRLNQKAFLPMLLVGDIAVTVTEFVAKHDIALVVLGSRAVGLNRFLRGSISEEVFRSVDCPVLTVGPHAKSPRGAVGIKHVLFPSNLEKRSGSVLTHFDFLFKGNPCSGLAVAHFLPTESKSVVERYKTRKALHAQLIALVPDNVRGRIDDVVVESCSPAKGILEFSREGRADLVILAVRDAGSLARAATHRPRSITHQVIQSATCPVLTFRA